MIKVAFFLSKFIPPCDFDASALLRSNPGMGGIEYVELLVAYLLQQRKNGIGVKLFSDSCKSLNGFENVELVKDIADAVARSNNDSVDYLIVCHNRQMVKTRSLDLSSLHTKLIIWYHLFPTKKELDYYADNELIWKLVHVGKEAKDLFIDHRSYSKSEYIFNCFSVRKDNNTANQLCRKNIVTYMGCISPVKGFHWLADEWKKVLREVPDAELFVIGSGQLYGGQLKTGPYGITDEIYEKRITEPLSVNGRLIPGIHFLGILGEEKYDILAKTKVGVANPTGNSETFCISGVEIQAMGAKLVTGKCPGTIDTVFNGIKIRKKGQLADAVISCLKSNDAGNSAVLDTLIARFGPDNVVCRWETLLTDGCLPVEPITNIFYRMKWLKIISHVLFPNSRWTPTIERYLLKIDRRWGKDRAKYKYYPE